MILSTLNTDFTPTVANVAVTFTSECIPPGQAIFSGLSNGDYTLQVDKIGYTSQSIPVTINSSWQRQNISLSPQ